jgi:hypothetical protein
VVSVLQVVGVVGVVSVVGVVGVVQQHSVTVTVTVTVSTSVKAAAATSLSPSAAAAPPPKRTPREVTARTTASLTLIFNLDFFRFVCSAASAKPGLLLHERLILMGTYWDGHLIRVRLPTFVRDRCPPEFGAPQFGNKSYLNKSPGPAAVCDAGHGISTLKP